MPEPTESLKPRTVARRALAGTGIVAATTAFQFAVSLGAQVALARLLSPGLFGQFAFVLLVQGFVASFRSVQAGEYLVCRRDRVDETFHTVFTVDLVLSLVTTLVVVGCADALMSAAGRPELAGFLRLSIVSCLILPFGVAGALLHREIRFGKAAAPQVAGVLVGPVVKIGLALSGAGTWSLVIGELVRQTVEMAVLWSIAPVRPRLLVRPDLLRDAIRFSLPVTITSVIVYYYWKVDDFLVGRLLGVEALGYYWLAFRIPEYLMALRLHFAPVVLAALSRLESDGNRIEAFTVLTRFTAYGFGFPTAVALVFGDEIIRLVFGARWLPAAVPFKLLMLACLLRTSTAYSGDLFKVSGRTWAFPVVACVNAVLLTPLVYVFTIRWGIAGTAGAVLSMVLLSTPLVEWLVFRWFAISTCGLLVAPVAAVAAATLAGLPLREILGPSGVHDTVSGLLGLLDLAVMGTVFLATAALLDRRFAGDVRGLARIATDRELSTPEPVREA